MATYTEALTSIPEAEGAEWSSSFGNPGEGGYVEYHRTQGGQRWVIENGPYDAPRPFDWTCRLLGNALSGPSRKPRAGALGDMMGRPER